MIQALAYIISVKVETCSFVDILPWISHISSLTLIPYGVKVSIAAFQVGGRGSNTCVGETHVRFCILIFMCQVTGNYLGHALKKIFSLLWFSFYHSLGHSASRVFEQIAGPDSGGYSRYSVPGPRNFWAPPGWMTRKSLPQSQWLFIFVDN